MSGRICVEFGPLGLDQGLKSRSDLSPLVSSRSPSFVLELDSVLSVLDRQSSTRVHCLILHCGTSKTVGRVTSKIVWSDGLFQNACDVVLKSLRGVLFESVQS
jgi:hypothetical protein